MHTFTAIIYTLKSHRKLLRNSRPHYRHLTFAETSFPGASSSFNQPHTLFHAYDNTQRKDTHLAFDALIILPMRGREMRLQCERPIEGDLTLGAADDGGLGGLLAETIAAYADVEVPSVAGLEADAARRRGGLALPLVEVEPRVDPGLHLRDERLPADDARRREHQLLLLLQARVRRAVLLQVLHELLLVAQGRLAVGARRARYHLET